MPKLWLLFKDESGEEKRVEVDRTPFIVGRHSGCNLTIVDSRLSREHLQIEWQTDKFVASDRGSSNGTTLNGQKLSEAVGLKNEDALNLGGIEIQVVLEGAESADPAEPALPPSNAEPPSGGLGPTPPSGLAVAAAGAGSVASTGPNGGIPTAFFLIGPLLGVFVIAAVIGAIVMLGGDKKQVASNPNNYGYSDEDDDTDSDNGDEPSKPPKSPTPIASGTAPTPGPIATSSPISGGPDVLPPGDGGELAKVERNGAAFLRKAAQKDENAFLTSEQSAAVASVLKRIGKSPALADNINSARKNASAIKSLAASKGLKPQFLAVAAITKLGGSRGDVLQAAQGVIDVYDKLAIHVNNENSDDVLLLVAAYDQGVAGEFRKLRDLLQQLASKDGAPQTRELRTIWYLEKTGNLARADYERALNFLAIGTIAQNPKEFGVNAEALSL